MESTEERKTMLYELRIDHLEWLRARMGRYEMQPEIWNSLAEKELKLHVNTLRVDFMDTFGIECPEITFEFDEENRHLAYHFAGEGHNVVPFERKPKSGS